MGGCAKNHDKGKDGKDGKDGNSLRAGVGVLALIDSADGFDVGPEKRLYRVTLSGKQSSVDPTPETLDEHLSHLAKMTKAGQLDSCGASADGQSGFQLIVADSYNEAMNIVSVDPLLSSGYYRSVSIEEVVRP